MKIISLIVFSLIALLAVSLVGAYQFLGYGYPTSLLLCAL